MEHWTEPQGIGAGSRLQALAERVGSKIGVPFLEHLVRLLQDAMGADLVFVAITDLPGRTRARAVCALEAGLPIENFEYDLDGTPCEIVCRGQVLVVPEKVAERFPREQGMEGYVGVPLRDGDGEPVGHLVVFSKQPILEPDMAEGLLRLFGSRIEADLRHQALLDERDALIADLRLTNETLNRRNQALHDTNQLKTGLMGMIAHDLRNPLAVVVSSAELLESHLSKPQIDREALLRRVSKISKSADRLTGLIEATLTRCKADSGKIELRRRRAEIRSLARVAIDTNAAAALRKGITLSMKPGPEIWACVDDGLCLEAIDNLVSNAIKYSPLESRVEIRFAADRSSLTVSVVDEGQGLSASDLRDVFRPFQTLSSRPTAGETATGLGLANVRSIAEAHGGEVRAESPGKGKGATFHIRLPRVHEIKGPGMTTV